MSVGVPDVGMGVRNMLLKSLSFALSPKPLMLPAFMLRLLPLLFRLDVLLTEFFFLRVPLRDGVPKFDALDAER